MKNLIRLFLLSNVLLLMQQKAISQDRMIVRFKTDTLLIKVIEVGVSEVKYKLWPVSESMPVMVESKEKVRRIIFENGTIMRFAADEFTDATNYSEQRKMVIKFDMIAITRKVFVFSFEKSLKPGVSVEAGIGVIAQNNYEGEFYQFHKASGFFARLGYKFINQPDFRMKGMRYTHILKGGYIKPELIYLSQTTLIDNYRSYNYPVYGTNYTTTCNITGYAGFLNFGKQWVLDDIFAVDFYVGLGIGAKSLKTSNNNGNQPLSGIIGDFNITETGGYGFWVYTLTNDQISFATQAGLKVGILIGSKKKAD